MINHMCGADYNTNCTQILKQCVAEEDPNICG